MRVSTYHWIGCANNETDWINSVKRKDSRERGNFRTGNNAQDDEEEDEPPQAPTPVRTPDERVNNKKYDTTPGRCLEARMNVSRREAVNMLKVYGMSKREIKLRCIQSATKCHPDK